MWQGGGEIVTPDGKHSAFASPATLQALKFWQDAIQQNVAPRNMLGTGGWDPIANLASGFCAMQNLGIWGVSALRDNAKDFQYGVFPLPLPPNGQQRTSFGGPRKRQSSAFGRWVPRRTIAFKESLTGVPRRTLKFRRENRLWKKRPPKEGTAAPR